LSTFWLASSLARTELEEALDMRLQGKTALITGAAQGIGRAIAQRFVREGAGVTMADIDLPTLTAAAAEIGAHHVVTDVSNRAGVSAMVSAALSAHGHIDILVNNAGVTHAAPFLDLLEADFDRVLAVNLKSAFLAGQAVGRHMRDNGHGGVIINMSSVNDQLAIPTQTPYAVSKGGMSQLTKVMALSLIPHRIRVNAIGPGTILTELARSIMVDRAAEDMILSRTPIGRCGDPDEVASCAVFLASDDASYIVGQTIYPDGGRLALNYVVPVAAR
jgi:NAD(P)-dependent dehydrogenase (short-subunit alcohol dehydrogenase family)